jgi:uncharacterized protein (DUF362 family)
MALQNDAVGRREALLQLLRVGGLGAGVAGLGYWLSRRQPAAGEPAAVQVKRDLRVAESTELPALAVAQGDDPAALVRRAVEELGGMRRFVSRGDVVVVKPNVSWDRTPEQAANTNPDITAEAIRLCYDAGAKSVVLADVNINNARRCYQRSGIGEAAARMGAKVMIPEDRLFRRVDLHGDTLRDWPVFEPFLNADKIINLPIAKNHNLCGVTLAFKNWYGIVGGQRQRLHQRIHESLADLGSFLRPTLTVLDGYRVLLRGGPSGGNLEDVAQKKTILAGTDPVAIDAWAAKAWWNLDAAGLLYLPLAARRGLGTTEFETLRVRAVSV